MDRRPSPVSSSRLCRGAKAHSHFRLYLGLTLAVASVLLPSPLDANESPQATSNVPAGDEPSRFRLYLTLDPEQPPPTGFTLDLAQTLDQDEEPGRVEPLPLAGLSLSNLSQTLNGRAPALFGPDFAEELRRMRWPDGIGRREHILASEQARMLSGSSPGSCQAIGTSSSCATGPMVDLVEVYRLLSGWWRARKEARKPAGARLQQTQEVSLQVYEADGSAAVDVNVLPLTMDWVGEALPASCDQGLCRVTGLPDAASTLLVRGHGAALIRLSRFDAVSVVRLQPVGWLKLQPGHAQEIVRVRVVETASGLTVPVVRWINPERGAEVTLRGRAIPLLLPAGDYSVESTSSDGRTFHQSLTVVPDERVELVVPPSDPG